MKVTLLTLPLGLNGNGRQYTPEAIAEASERWLAKVAENDNTAYGEIDARLNPTLREKEAVVYKNVSAERDTTGRLTSVIADVELPPHLEAGVNQSDVCFTIRANPKTLEQSFDIATFDVSPYYHWNRYDTTPHFNWDKLTERREQNKAIKLLCAIGVRIALVVDPDQHLTKLPKLHTWNWITVDDLLDTTKFNRKDKVVLYTRDQSELPVVTTFASCIAVTVVSKTQFKLLRCLAEASDLRFHKSRLEHYLNKNSSERNGIASLPTNN